MNFFLENADCQSSSRSSYYRPPTPIAKRPHPVDLIDGSQQLHCPEDQLDYEQSLPHHSLPSHVHQQFAYYQLQNETQDCNDINSTTGNL